jgi:hypothetical protein
VLGHERAVVGDPDQRPRVAREYDDRAGAKDGVDGAALEAELAQVGAPFGTCGTCPRDHALDEFETAVVDLAGERQEKEGKRRARAN